MKLLMMTILLTTIACRAENPPINAQAQEAELKLLPSEKQTIKIYKNASLSVVNVSNIKTQRDFYYGQVDVPQGSGSGYVWDNEGHIVTNFHVVQGGDQFMITFKNNKKQYKAKIVGVEPKKDIAVLKLIKNPKTLNPIEIGKSKDLQVGQLTLAIGNPFGLDHTLTTGVISALGREIKGIGGVKIFDMIQTDASINSGNSGGPLLNSSGKLIGMNTMIFSTSGASSGLGFAVPVDTINMVVPQLIKHGKVIQPALGISPLPEQYARRFFKKGVVIASVQPDGAAKEANLQGMKRDQFGRTYFGDIVLKIENMEVNNLDDIYQALQKYKVGDTVTITYLRDEKEKKATLKLRAL